MNQQKIGKFIAERRKIKQLTQIELAEKLGVSNRTISKWENGNSLPDYSMFHDLCSELDISINELLSGEKLTEDNYQKKLEENFVSTIDYNNKKRNKKIKITIIIFVVFVFLYLFYKIFITYFYYKDYSTFELREFPINKNIETVQIHNNDKENTVVFSRLNIYIPDGFELITDKAKSSFVTDKCRPYIKGLNDKNNFDAMILVCDRSNSDNLYNLDYHGIHNTIFPYMDTYALLDKYSIDDSVDMIKFYEKHYNFKQNIFTSSDDIKINHIVRQYVKTLLPTYDYFYYLENDIRGYSIESLVSNKYFQQAVVVYYDTAYGISFHNNNEEYFNHDNSFEIINSIYWK